MTDYDNSLTSATEYDILGRPIKTITAPGDALESWTTMEYHDHDRFQVVKSDLETKGVPKKVATQFYDQLGRVRLSKTLEDASTQSATNETDGIKVETKYEYASGYTYQLTSNPFRASSSSGATGEETMGWTRTKQWATGRESQVETFSGATKPGPWDSNTTSTGVVQTDIAANATTVTDQAGKLRRSITNSLGQLSRVDEPNSSNVLGSVSSPNQDTDYTYDVLNNLLTVSQGSQTRTFTYSSLARLLTAANPESGTISYGYDSNGNLTSKTDARSVVTAYTYDALNRVTQRSYSGESGYTTPTVTYTYDAQTHAKGKLTKVSSSVSATEYTSFDILGRVTGHKQTIGGTDYTTAYTYNLGGAMLTETYPSGRMVKNTLATNGDLSQVETKPSSGSYTTRASNFVYNPAGAAQSLELGNSKYETTHFNARLQPTTIGLGTSTSDTSLLKLAYDYGTTANNGNVVSQEITVPGLTPHFIQTYTYDSLNRLASATETYNSSQTWKQTFTYDRYGNRNFDEANTTMPSSFSTPAVSDPTVSATTNRLTSSGYTYDNAGDTTADANSRTFVYDGENKQVSVSSGGTNLGTYYYDGDGKRVKKTSSTSDNIIFIYDAGGKLLEERNSSSCSGSCTLLTSYVYAGGRLLSTEIETSSATNYLTADNLGTPRINTDGSGNVVARHDYHPFGEEIATSQRTSGVGYSSDTIRKQFTSYERDGETDLDFAQARMYSHRLGKFMSGDPFMPSGKTGSPQTWNRYTYALNNPLSVNDTDGLDPKPVFREFKDLSPDEIRILNASSVSVTVIVDGKKVQKNLSGQELYDTLAATGNKEGNKQIANFLNQTAVLASQVFSNGRSAISYVESVTAIQQDRIYANVQEGFKNEVEKLSDKKLPGGIKYLGPENSSALHHDYDTSFRQNLDEAPEQLSFASNTKFRTADIDIDYCLKGSLCHGGEVFGNWITGNKTDPYKVYKLLGERPNEAIKPNYSISK